MSESYTPSCNWRNLQKIIKKNPKKTVKKQAIRTNLRKELHKEKEKVEKLSKTFFSASNFPKQINRSEEYAALPEKEAESKQKTRIGRYIALDCEMVQVGPCNKKDQVLARISIVNYHGNIILDTFVKPKEKVVDYKTWITGITRSDLENAPSFEEVQKKVSEILKDKILIGHAIKNDLNVLFLSHPRKNIRDTSKFKKFRIYSKGKTPSLKKLAKEILNITIQHQAHSSIEDARTSMLLYKRFKEEMDRASLTIHRT